jgi:Trm5-related predicted tRNA methylase
MHKIKSLELKRSDQVGSNPIDKNVNRNPEFPWTFLDSSNTQMHNHINLEEQRHQIKMASSKLIHFMIFFKIAYVADEFHKS